MMVASLMYRQLPVIGSLCSFRTAIHGMPRVIDKTKLMVRACTALGVPTIVTEQYPERLGATVPEITSVLPEKTPIVPKMKFSMWTDDVARLVTAEPRDQCIVVRHVMSEGP